ncbi:MAG TPA: hypothetical protein VKM72_12390 [Thermoanaerobaculia bacterium]|nr:hypothetical protein [Thermoanaerobaculia bacterium]
MLTSRSTVAGILVVLILLALTALSSAAGASAFSTGPSAFCHVTDGAFTDCHPGGGAEEWSDISYLSGLGTSAGAIVYTDQSVTPPRLLLMYDLLLHQQPLAPSAFFEITFNVVEDGEFEQYGVRCFGNNTFQVFEDGEDITPEATTVDCAVGFNGHNVQVELEIDTLVTYSPDIPLFWSTFAPPGCRSNEPGCKPCPPNEPGCRPAGAPAALVQTSATVVIASSDGTTQVVGLPVGAITPASLCDKPAGTGALVDLLGLFAGGSHGQLVSRTAHDARLALESLASFGVIAEDQIGKLQGCVVSTLGRQR